MLVVVCRKPCRRERGCYIDFKKTGEGKKRPLPDCWTFIAGLGLTLVAKESADSLRLKNTKNMVIQRFSACDGNCDSLLTYSGFPCRFAACTWERGGPSELRGAQLPYLGNERGDVVQQVPRICTVSEGILGPQFGGHIAS